MLFLCVGFQFFLSASPTSLPIQRGFSLNHLFLVEVATKNRWMTIDKAMMFVMCALSPSSKA